METTNKLFSVNVVNVTSDFNQIRKLVHLENELYVSKHFIERVVERNLRKEIPFMIKMLHAVVVQLRETTYTHRIYKCRWKNLIVVAKIAIGKQSNNRYVTAVTCYDNDRQFDYDEEIVF